jgi:ribosomal protein S27AE
VAITTREKNRRYVARHPEWRREASRRYKRTHAEKNRAAARAYKEKNPEKHAAHMAVSYAIKKGILRRPARCPGCKQLTKVQAHHDDYSKPMIVKWFCAKCHKAEHL